MVKRSKVDNSAVQTVGLDIGYGVVKAVNREGALTFPSVWARAVDTRFQSAATSEKYPGDDMTDDGGDWWIGDKAQKHAPGDTLRYLRGRTADESSIGHVDRLRLLKTALGKLYPQRLNGDVLHFRIASGLPVEHMRGANDLKAALIGQHRIQTDSAEFVANIGQAFVMPQPYGTIYSQMLQANGALNPCHTFTRTGVVDVGTYTVDLALDDDGEYIDESSASIEAGVYRVQQAIAADYERRFEQKAGYADIETIIQSGCVRVRGKVEDFTPALNDAKTELSEATLNLMGRVWGKAARVDVIYLAGGGAGMVVKAVRAAYPQTQLVTDAQLSNAQGYYNFALFKATGE